MPAASLPVHPRRCTPNFLTPPRPVPGRPRPTCKVQLCILKTVRMHRDRQRQRQTIFFIDIDIIFVVSFPTGFTDSCIQQNCL